MIRALKETINVARREIREGRFQRSMAALAGTGAVITGFEAWSQHLKGAFSNRLMWTPIVLAPPMTAAAAGAIWNRRVGTTFLPALSVTWFAAGAVGFYNHVRGVRRLPGGFRLGRYNLVMGPPVFAPLLVTSVGTLGLLAGFSRPEVSPEEEEGHPEAGKNQGHDRESGPTCCNKIGGPVPRTGRSNPGEGGDSPVGRNVARGKFQKRMAAIAAAFAALTGGEAYFEHLRGSFNKQSMWAPVVAGSLVSAAGVASVASEMVAERFLPLCSGAAVTAGMTGAMFHFQAIRRMPGGLSNLKFNFSMGPPLFAPLLLTMVGLMGLTASLLRRKK
ncbi:MAG TPA: hypothetical protein VLS90_09525 [Thermodesulfobacteriota bacterium]|nr:hypothetical protein [Thermodesulfobacteriota bacterium]